MYPAPNYQNVTVRISLDHHYSAHEYDEMTSEENPMGYRFVSFNTRHANFMNPDEVPAGSIPLSYYEHELCLWSPAGTGPKCDFDSVGYAGAIICDDESAKWYRDEDHPERVKSLCEYFTDVCNNSGFYVVEVGDESIGGVYAPNDIDPSEVADLFPSGAIGSVEVVDEDGYCDWVVDKLAAHFAKSKAA